MLLSEVALSVHLPSRSFPDRWEVVSAVDGFWVMQIAGRRHAAESAAALEVEDSVGKEKDALISVGYISTNTWLVL